jgi:CheY-like chemotaxis protein
MNGSENAVRRWPVTVLLVEDDLELAAALRRALVEHGCLVHLAQDGSEALEALGRMRPDVIVMDAVMAGMDGMETLQAVKSDWRHRDIPVIATSGSGEYREWALRAGADVFLLKPAGGETLFRTVKECIGAAAWAA